MPRYEVAIDIDKPEHVDALILGLVHNGYAVYYNADDKKLCFTATDEGVMEVKFVEVKRCND